MKSKIFFFVLLLFHFYFNLFAQTDTETPTNTETITETLTPILTETITATSTRSLTETFTYFETETFTQTITESITETITATVTKTTTDTITPTLTLTITPSLTFTITIFGYTYTPTKTFIAGATITETLTPAFTVTFTDYHKQNLYYTFYPNPVKYGENLFMLYECNEISDILIEIYAVNGRKIKEYNFENQESNGKIKLKVNDIAPGIYFYRAIIKNTNKEKKENIKKILILK